MQCNNEIKEKKTSDVCGAQIKRIANPFRDHHCQRCDYSICIPSLSGIRKKRNSKMRRKYELKPRVNKLINYQK